MKEFLKTKASLLAVLLSCVSIVLFYFLCPPLNVFVFDALGYYLYLPSLFIYNDLGIDNLNWITEINNQYQCTSTFYQFSQTPLGHNVIQYTMGVAVLNLPFFGIAHFIAWLTDGPADGFSRIYQLGLIIGYVFYVIVGLNFLRKVLLHFFKDWIASIVILSIVFGTNYFRMATAEIGMTHSYLFSLYAILIWTTIKWHEKKSISFSLILGLLLGFIMVIRPSEIVCVLIPLFYGFKNISERFQIFKKYYRQIIIIGLAALAIGLLQLIYWQIYSGSFLYVSYRNPGEGMDFLSPYIKEVLFSFRKGWFIYTPIMILAVLGIFFLKKRAPNFILPITLFFLLNLWIVSSWSVWWYAHSFSQRALVQSYAILSLPLGAFYSNLFEWNKRLRILLTSIIGLLMMLNLFQTWQMHKGIMDGYRMTKDYYWAIFGQTTDPTEEQKDLLLINRIYNGKEEVFTPNSKYFKTNSETLDFEDNSGTPFPNAHSGSKVLKLGFKKRFSPEIKHPFRQLTPNDHAWIKLSAWVWIPEDTVSPDLILIASFQNKDRKNYKYRAKNVGKLGHVPLKKWFKVELDYLTPEVRHESDCLSAGLWYRGKGEVFIDDVKFESYVRE